MKRAPAAGAGPGGQTVSVDQVTQAAVDRAARQILELAYDLLEDRRRQERVAERERRILVQ